MLVTLAFGWVEWESYDESYLWRGILLALVILYSMNRIVMGMHYAVKHWRYGGVLVALVKARLWMDYGRLGANQAF